MVFWGENSPSSLHKKWCEVTQNDSFLIVINLIYNIVFFQGQNRAENRKGVFGVVVNAYSSIGFKRLLYILCFGVQCDD